MANREILAALLTAALAIGCACWVYAADAELEAEIQRLGERVDGFEVIALPGDGEITLTLDQALTAEDLRGVTLDDTPPVLGEPPGDRDTRMVDEWPDGEAPYEAPDIAPFRFDYFTTEFSYGGWHNWHMHEYAATHGFGVLSAYRYGPDEWTHMPEGTRWLKWGGLVNWHKWMDERGIEERHYHELADLDLLELMLQEKSLAHNPQFDQLMIDMEHGLIGPEKLREQDWYPADGTDAEKAALEQRYYDAYAQTYVAPVEAARQNGWRDISVYGWQPFSRTFWGLGEATADPATHFGWNAYGRRIYDAVDILNPSVYCFYASRQNVAYTLANIDLNMRLIASADEHKPMRPYYWNLLHGGGGGERWWARQPLPDEDMRAMTAMCFFTGCDGLVLWSWSGTGNHHRPRIEAEQHVMVGEAFALEPEAGGEATGFARYDVLYVDEVAEDGPVQFRLVNPGAGNLGVEDGAPVFAMARDELAPLLRPDSSPIAAMVEGLALVKPLEYLLRHGEVVIDVPAQQQFANTLPIVRRVAFDGYHAIATYDPMALETGQARTVSIEIEGAAVIAPADEQVRIFVLQAQQ
ncbi:MAG: hypothetical protein GF393_11615 [Armatimonadia bacterium]|nr:hypothetical protein [Armatimonadia bacterium]